MKIKLLGDEATVHALRLAGVEGISVPKGQDPTSAFEELLEEEELGLLLVTEPLAEVMRERVDRAKVELHFPLVLEIPARGVAPESVDDLVARVARLIGINR